ncbi:hypothetical protein D3OALGB2SA_5839 [Olavius algarvensis associated proteobacterium Delta 3]|nr:hypothetical protein D3OALGB2SA_5839 [Olavius algarvensis associated proteobacterium Delta 3]
MKTDIVINMRMSTLNKSLTIAFLAISIFISGLNVDFVGAQSSAPEPMVTLTPEEQAWLKAHPEIVLGAPTNYPPSVIRQADGTHIGLTVDLFEQISRVLNTSIGLHIEDSWSDIQEKAKNREIDGLALGARDTSRDAIYNATDVVMPTYFSVFGRSRIEYQIERFSDLDSLRIGYKSAARPTRSLLERLPSATLKPYDSHESLTQALVRREIDVIVAWMSYDHWRKQKLQGTIDKILIIEEYPIEIVTYVRNDWPELIPILNKAIAALKQDELPRIINKWFGEWPQRFFSDRLSLTAEEMAWIKTHPRIMARVGNFPPFHSTVQGKPTGFSIDLLDRIAALAGFDVGYVSSIPWPEGLELIRQRDGRVDLQITAMNTADHREIMVFSKDYLELPFKVLTRADNTDIKDFDDLIGKTVAIEKGYALVKMVREAYPDIKVKEVLGFAPAALRTVSSGKADAYIGNLPVANYHISNLGLVNLKVAASTPFDFHKLGFGVRKDWPELASILDKAMGAIPLKERLSLQEKWGLLERKEAESVSIMDQLSGLENAWLDQKHPVRVRIADYPPYQIIKGKEAPQGITIEYLKLIEERTGIEFRYEVSDQPFAEFLESMKQGKGPDMTALIIPTPEREQYVSFTAPYLSSPYVIFIREEDNPILDIQGLFGKTLAVPKGVVVQEQLSKDYPEIKLTLFDSDEKALEAVATGQADAFIGNLTVASHIIHQMGLSHLKVTAAVPYGNQVLSMGNRKDWPELTSIIDKALASITEEEKTAIRNKYLAIKFEQGIDKVKVLRWILVVGGAASGIMLIFVFWNRRLSWEISKRKKTELALKQAKDYAENAQVAAEAANQAKSIFLASMSHELRTPLNAILGFSGMLTREENATHDQQEKLSIINRSGQHLLAMINDVLDLSKIEAGSVELDERPFDLAALIEEIGTMIQSRAGGKGLSFTSEAETINIPYIKADEGKLRQILINLLNNAVKFTDEGGVTIRCATEAIPEEPKHCNIMIEVEDTGPGIEPTRQAQIFEPFVQEIDTSDRRGTGLGLSICKKYAEFMGGTIELDSEVGKGSLFRLQLPAKITEAADIKAPVDDKPRVIGLAPTEKTWRILLADDNRENLILLKSLLESVGFFVLEAENGKEALEAFKKESPDFIWMDMRMPVMDGYEATRRIRKWESGSGKSEVGSRNTDDRGQMTENRGPHPASSDQRPVPIIASTASAFREQRQEILAAGCDDMVIKPYKAHEIFEVMGRFLDIKYIYETESEAAPDHRIGEVDLTSNKLAELPVGLLNELREAILALNREAALGVIARIGEQIPEVAEGLREMVENFQMGKIRDLLEDIE